MRLRQISNQNNFSAKIKWRAVLFAIRWKQHMNSRKWLFYNFANMGDWPIYIFRAAGVLKDAAKDALEKAGCAVPGLQVLDSRSWRFPWGKFHFLSDEFCQKDSNLYETLKMVPSIVLMVLLFAFQCLMKWSILYYSYI